MIFLTKDQMLQGRIKHIDVHYHVIREVIAHGDIVVSKICTHDNPINQRHSLVPSLSFIETQPIFIVGPRSFLW